MTTVGSSLPVLSTTVGCHPYQFQPAAQPALNPTTKHFLHGDLFEAPVAPFRGDQSLFHSWRTSLQKQIMELGLSAGNIINVLGAHTAGEAQKVVLTFRLQEVPMPRNAFKKLRTS